ncbi:DUF3995 domain-containing protein [Macrococcus lamae]|uniref:DUF3995 domain-containing protein n=1 Tax=Macrococcus lamae TaxID=198484 RepID=A0A4R6BSZ2_9STAP|nr:DUF3995 domain-containing protein [Macrococcus lamae]TDM07502.1 DUF3995 domain-containing protein [Macrococcus lamae]
MQIKKWACIVFLIAGTLHSLATFYWSYGGELGLATVGEWTFKLKQQYGNRILIGLFFLGLFKLAATWLPAILYKKEVKALRLISYAGAVILIVHGGGNTIVGWLKFLNIIPRKNTLSEIGQAFIWDPLFLIWGCSLLLFLLSTRVRRNNI